MAASGSRFTVMPPVELQEAIFSLCWATGRAGVEELKGVKEQFRLLYPKAFGLDEYGRPLEQVRRPRSRLASRSLARSDNASSSFARIASALAKDSWLSAMPAFRALTSEVSVASLAVFSFTAFPRSMMACSSAATAAVFSLLFVSHQQTCEVPSPREEFGRAKLP